MQCRDRRIEAPVTPIAPKARLRKALGRSPGRSPRNRNKKRLALKASDKMETTGRLSRLEVEPRFQRLLHWGPEFLGYAPRLP